MKNSLSVKFVAVILCALMLLGALGSGLCLGVLGSVGALGDTSVSQTRQEATAAQIRWCAEEAAIYWASGEYGGMPQELVDARIREAFSNSFENGKVYFTVQDKDGNTLFSNYSGQENVENYTFRFDSVNFDRFLTYGFVSEDEPAIESVPDQNLLQAPMASGLLRTSNAYTTYFYDQTSGRLFQYVVCPGRAPGVDVTLHLAPGARGDAGIWALMDALWYRKGMLVGVLVGCLLLFAAFAVYLCSSAAHKPGTEDLKPAGLNALPLDLYAGGVVCVVAMCLTIADEFDKWILEQHWQTIALCIGGLGFVGCLAFVAFCFAFAAQVKMPGAYWWWNSITGRCLKLAVWVLKKGWKLLSWLVPELFRLLRRLIRDLWKVAMAMLTLAVHTARRVLLWLGQLLRRIGKTAEHFFSLLPLTWQWLAVGGFMLLYAREASHSMRSNLSTAAIWIAVIVYGAYCFGSLLEGVKKMRSGKLEEKVEGKYMIGGFRQFSEELNGLAGVAVVAAEKQLKSDRMKTELITNVSHDIKTPLTSIINYVDLLQKPHTPEQEQQYLEVLSRQSGRMKKLIEDLMEMSKASTGNIPVEITEIDATEAVNQALGEFSDKLAASGVTPVFQCEEEVRLLADGRLLWRAMSNLLSNAVKYAMPGTRLYVDVSTAGDKAVISFKNISGAALNISAEELMERFVRGDASRNTEGSGLGLNITKSLMELQKGHLELLVDGDLFKATLIFPKA